MIEIDMKEVLAVAEERSSAYGSFGSDSLKVWRASMTLAEDVYRATVDFPKREQFGLSNQLRSAAVSIPSNLAEGSGRSSSKEFAYFVSIANGSLRETHTQILLAGRLRLISETQSLVEQCDAIGKMLTKLRQYLEKRAEAKSLLPPKTKD